MTSKKARKRDRARRKGKARAKITMTDGQSIPQVAVNDPRREKPEDPRSVVFASRIRQRGIKDTPENRRDMVDPMQGCAIGRALTCKANRVTLWEAACHARRTVAAYDRACGAPGRHPQVLRILAPRDVLHADAASPGIDPRTTEERDAQAVAAWTRLHGWMMHCDGPARTAFTCAVIDELDAPIRDMPGVLNVLACIAEGMAGEIVKVRVRLT